MANKLDPMDLKQIITLHLDGLSNRKVSKQLSDSRHTRTGKKSRIKLYS